MSPSSGSSEHYHSALDATSGIQPHRAHNAPLITVSDTSSRPPSLQAGQSFRCCCKIEHGRSSVVKARLLAAAHELRLPSPRSTARLCHFHPSLWMGRIIPSPQNLLTNLGTPVAWFASNPIVWHPMVRPCSGFSGSGLWDFLGGFIDSVFIWQIPTGDTKATRGSEEAGVFVFVRNDRFVTMLTKG